MEMNIRGTMLAVVERLSKDNSGSLQSGTILRQTAEHLKSEGHSPPQVVVLTQFNELIRTGYLGWGLDFSNPNPPFLHLTAQGRRSLARLSADPSNPSGYLARIDATSGMPQIARAYIEEAVNCYVADLNKAAAVMVGCAAEDIVLHLRDAIRSRLDSTQKVVSKDLIDWRIARVLTGIRTVLDRSKDLPKPLRERYEANWPAFTHQIRSARNDAGHPSNISPVTSEAVHASLLIFPELLTLAIDLMAWVRANDLPDGQARPS